MGSRHHRHLRRRFGNPCRNIAGLYRSSSDARVVHHDFGIHLVFVVILIMCIVAGVLAAILPARRAARLNVLGAIAHSNVSRPSTSQRSQSFLRERHLASLTLLRSDGSPT